MRMVWILGIVAVCLMPVLAGCAHTSGHGSAACVCEQAQAGETMWCDACSEGFVDGKMVTHCEGCFAAKTGGPACEGCAKKE